MVDIDIEERKQMAVSLFNQGYNCAQAVFATFSDYTEIEQINAIKMTASFGGGMGKLRETCGAVTSMFMCMNYIYPSTQPDDLDARTQNYAAVQRTASIFKDKYGTINCGELLKLKPDGNARPSERTDEYYAKRPCSRFVSLATEIIAKEILENQKNTKP